MKKSRIIAFMLAVIVLACTFAVPVSAASITFKPELVNGKIYGIPVGATLSVLRNVYYNAVVDVTTSKGVAIGANDMIGTGYIVKINGISYTAVVMGDVDGDATLTTADYIVIKRAYLGTYEASDIALEASGLDIANEELSTLNYIVVKRAYMGTYDINAKYSCDPYDPEENESGWTDGWV